MDMLSTLAAMAEIFGAVARMQWLAERIAEEEAQVVPAYLAYPDWRRGH